MSGTNRTALANLAACLPHDRFSRSGSNDIHIADQLAQLGIGVVAVTQPVDTLTASGKLQQGIQFLFSQFDNDQRREKCMTGMEAKVRKGYVVGKAPMGYDQLQVNGEQVVKPNKQGKLIRLAFQLKAEQGLSNTDIIQRLKAQGLTLYNQTLTKIFRNPFYCGLITHGLQEEGEVVVGRHEPLVSREMFLRVNGLQQLNSPRLYPGERGRAAALAPPHQMRELWKATNGLRDEKERHSLLQVQHQRLLFEPQCW